MNTHEPASIREHGPLQLPIRVIRFEDQVASMMQLVWPAMLRLSLHVREDVSRGKLPAWGSAPHDVGRCPLAWRCGRLIMAAPRRDLECDGPRHCEAHR